jgi:hypothetical protein
VTKEKERTKGQSIAPLLLVLHNKKEKSYFSHSDCLNSIVTKRGERKRDKEKERPEG